MKKENEEKGNFKSMLATLGITSSVSYVSYELFSETLFNRIFKTRKSDKDYDVDGMYLKWLSNSNVDEVMINSFDGLTLSGYRIYNHDTKNYLILVPGLNENKTSLYHAAYAFDKLGYNILLIDNRGNGNSEGEHVTYGYKEHLDIIKWIGYLTNKVDDVKICLYGVSLGASSICMALGSVLPENVKCAVEDSGYSTFEEELEYVLLNKYRIKVPKVLSTIAGMKLKEKFNITLSDINPKESLMNNEIPICFVHSKNDEIVPYSMGKKLYNANKGFKKFYILNNESHACGYMNPNYFSVINSFISNFM